MSMRYSHYRVAIIGSGAAAYSTADWLQRAGVDDIAIITEDRMCGTSRNAGSDKQTYYKLSMSADSRDSVRDMANTLYSGGAMDGDIALIEAAGSVRSFFRLVEYGVPFPTDRYGVYVGYRTDHDDSDRATSAGPLTSRYMTETLERHVLDRGATLLDKMTAVRIVTEGGRAAGVVTVNSDGSIGGVTANYIVIATGGPASVYRDTVYPLGQTGMMSLAIDVGADMVNMSEWQYGIASVKFRWNLSGSYQQVIPRYYSVGDDGEEREFLADAMGVEESLARIFLKGYQWPFDSAKIDGSSAVDMAVQNEILAGRRVFVDYTRNAKGYSIHRLSKEARSYLTEADAIGDRPVDRLMRLNPKAVDLYLFHGIDLFCEPLEIAVCAQHLNGGIAVDTDWQTTVGNLFAVGEAAGTLGIYRPGGSALNSTQVGGLRIAQYISTHTDVDNADIAAAESALDIAVSAEREFLCNMTGDTVRLLDSVDADMSRYCSHVRVLERIREIYADIMCRLDNMQAYYSISSTDDGEQVRTLFKLRDRLTTQAAVCRTVLHSRSTGSRGGALLMENNDIITASIGADKVKLVLRGGVILEAAAKEIPEEKVNFEVLLRGMKNV